MGSIAQWRALDALRYADYRLLWVSNLCISVARWLDFLVLGWLVLDMTGSPFMVGLAAFCRFAPMIVLGMFAGVVTDRLPRGRVLVAVQCMNATVMLLLALLFLTGHGELWALIALETLFGCNWAVDFPVRRTLLFTLVGPRGVTSAVSMDSISMHGTKIVGPLLGGVLLSQFGPATCYVILACLFSLALLLTVRLVRRVHLPVPTSDGESILADLASGFKEARAQPAILQVLLITIVINGLVFPYQQILPVFAREVLEVGPEMLGLMVSAGGFGSLVGALWTASRRDFMAHRQVFALGSMLSGVLVIVQSFSSALLVALPIQFGLGVAEATFSTTQSTILLLAAHERTRGRVFGIMSVCVGTAPFGALALGIATTYIGAPLSFGISAGLGLLLMAPVARRLLADGSAPLRIGAEEPPAARVSGSGVPTPS